MEASSASTKIKNIIGLHRVIANSIAMAKRRLSGSELRFLREQLAFSASELASLVEYSEDHVRKIESASLVPKAPYEMFLRVAVLNGLKAPNYDLHELVNRKGYEIEDLTIRNKKNRDWELTRAS